MIQSTFSHIHGIGLGSEKRLWEEGYLTWEDLRTADTAELPVAFASVIPAALDETVERFASRDWDYFRKGLRSTEYWRLFPHVRENIAYFDIETTGLGKSTSHITSIALYDGKQVYTYVYGQNLDDFPADIATYDALVTYSGKAFDVPFVEKFFGIKLNQFHLDLRYVLASLGYKGGLKGAERALGLSRGSLDGVDGFFAVLLWDDYTRRGNDKALETLLAYNIEDVVNLEKLAIMAYNLKLHETPFAERYRQDEQFGPDPAIDFVPDMETLVRLAKRVGRRLGPPKGIPAPSPENTDG